MDQRLALGLAGSLLLGIGVFTPIIRLPVVGGVNYFRNGTGDGVLVLIVALLSLLLTLRRRFHWLWMTGIASIALLIGTFLRFQQVRVEAQRDIALKLSDNPFRGVADVAFSAVQIEWGWAILVLAASLLVAAASFRNVVKLRRCPHCAELIQHEATVCKHCKRDVATQALPSTQPESRFPLRVMVTTGIVVVAIVVTMWVEPLLWILIRMGLI